MGFYIFLYRYLEGMLVFPCLGFTITKVNDYILTLLLGINNTNKRQEEEVI
jgi:hypothetical protein